jgi:hypothetical protein
MNGRLHKNRNFSLLYIIEEFAMQYIDHNEIVNTWYDKG